MTKRISTFKDKDGKNLQTTGFFVGKQVVVCIPEVDVDEFRVNCAQRSITMKAAVLQLIKAQNVLWQEEDKKRSERKNAALESDELKQLVAACVQNYMEKHV